MTGLFLLLFDDMRPDRTALLQRVSPQKRARLAKIRAEESMLQSLCADLLTRILLCERLACRNTELRFVAGAHGKPYLESHPAICFNASHTRGGIAAAVAASPVGVDVERADRAWDPRVARRFFTQEECARIFRPDGSADSERFFEIWTRKEAWLKYHGEGLAAPLSSFDVLFGEAAALTDVYRYGDYRLALCCTEQPEGPTLVSATDFTARALALEELF